MNYYSPPKSEIKVLSQELMTDLDLWFLKIGKLALSLLSLLLCVAHIALYVTHSFATDQILNRMSLQSTEAEISYTIIMISLSSFFSVMMGAVHEDQWKAVKQINKELVRRRSPFTLVNPPQ